MHALRLRPLAARVALVAVMGAAVTSSAWSQTGAAPATAASLGILPGARARVIVSDYGEDLQTGTITAVRGDSFVFRRDKAGDSLTVGYTHVARLDVGRGRHARTLTGLALGLLGGSDLPRAVPLYQQPLLRSRPVYPRRERRGGCRAGCCGGRSAGHHYRRRHTHRAVAHGIDQWIA